MILQVGETGELVLPGELVQAAPQTKLKAEREGDTLVIVPVLPDTAANAPLSEDMSTFWENFPSFASEPLDLSMTFRREDIYGDDGR